MKTGELIGPALDWAVAKCEGSMCQVWGLGSCRFNGVKIDINKRAGTYNLFVLRDSHFEEVCKSCENWPLARTQKIWTPSTDWSQGGPIIERIKGFEFKHWLESEADSCCEAHIHNYEGNWIAFGPTPLIAAMRCYVASKLGDEVDIPKELLGEQ